MDDAASKSLEEKLFVIDQEIRALHQFCTAKGFSQREIEKSAEPILEHLRNTKRKKWKWCLLTSVLAVAVAAAFARWEPAVRFVTACSRITMIKVGPVSEHISISKASDEHSNLSWLNLLYVRTYI